MEINFLIFLNFFDVISKIFFYLFSMFFLHVLSFYIMSFLYFCFSMFWRSMFCHRPSYSFQLIRVNRSVANTVIYIPEVSIYQISLNGTDLLYFYA